MRPRNCDTCAYCDRYRTQAPCNACMDNPTGGYIRWVDPSEAERARCLEIVEKVLAADSDLIADRIPRECEVASESRLIELVWQAAAKECLNQIRGQNGWPEPRKRWCNRCRSTGDIGNGRSCPDCERKNRGEK